MAVIRNTTTLARISGSGAGKVNIPIPDWYEHAQCAQVDLDGFYPEKGGSTRDAKRVCNGDEKMEGCPVRDKCLAFAVANDERFGIWGGKSERERRVLRKARDTEQGAA